LHDLRDLNIFLLSWKERGGLLKELFSKNGFDFDLKLNLIPFRI